MIAVIPLRIRGGMFYLYEVKKVESEKSSPAMPGRGKQANRGKTIEPGRISEPGTTIEYLISERSANIARFSGSLLVHAGPDIP